MTSVQDLALIKGLEDGMEGRMDIQADHKYKRSSTAGGFDLDRFKQLTESRELIMY